MVAPVARAKELFRLIFGPILSVRVVLPRSDMSCLCSAAERQGDLRSPNPVLVCKPFAQRHRTGRTVGESADRCSATMPRIKHVVWGLSTHINRRVGVFHPVPVHVYIQGPGQRTVD